MNIGLPSILRPSKPMTLAQRCAWLLQRNNRRRRQGAAGISALADLAGLLVEFRAVASSMSLNSNDLNSWSNVAGSAAVTLNYLGDGDAPPALVPNALGSGKDAVYFSNGKLVASVAWSPADLTAILVGSIDANNLPAAFPRWLSLERAALSEADASAADTWLVAGYDSTTQVFAADRNGARPMALPFDPTKNYLVATRKSGGTISAWVKPFDEVVATASGATTNVGLVVDTFTVGGNRQPQNLAGLIAHIGLWNRALTDAEVLAVLDYLGGIYE